MCRTRCPGIPSITFSRAASPRSKRPDSRNPMTGFNQAHLGTIGLGVLLAGSCALVVATSHEFDRGFSQAGTIRRQSWPNPRVNPTTRREALLSRQGGHARAGRSPSRSEVAAARRTRRVDRPSTGVRIGRYPTDAGFGGPVAVCMGDAAVDGPLKAAAPDARRTGTAAPRGERGCCWSEERGTAGTVGTLSLRTGERQAAWRTCRVGACVRPWQP